MDAKKCDRCGEFFEKNENGKFDGGAVFLFEFEGYWGRDEAKMYKELCKDCTKEFERWLGNENS